MRIRTDRPSASFSHPAAEAAPVWHWLWMSLTHRTAPRKLTVSPSAWPPGSAAGLLRQRLRFLRLRLRLALIPTIPPRRRIRRGTSVQPERMRPAGLSNQPAFECHISKAWPRARRSGETLPSPAGRLPARRKASGNSSPRCPGIPRTAGDIFNRMALFQGRPAPALLRIFPE